MTSGPGNSTVKLPMPEQIIGGRYRLLGRLGSGGMGLVFLAEQLGVGNKVAMKFLDPEPNADESRIARFLREAKMSLEVKHPGAAQLLDLGRDEAMRLYLVFEYIEGRDLRELLRDEGRLRFEEAKEIALKVAETLSFAHVRHIVHRDVKPENIRVRRDLAGVHVKVLDFGIARLLKDGGVRLTAEGSLAGTPRYMAPEQIRDTAIDGRTDQYALGLVFYEMLAGGPPFTGKNISQILLKQVQDPLPLLRTFAPELNFPQVDDVLSRACAKDPEERYPSMADFVGAVRALPADLAGRWPAPRATVGSPNAPTRDGKAVGLSDTFIRSDSPGNRTDVELAPPSRPAAGPTPAPAGAARPSTKSTRLSPLLDVEAPRPSPEVPTEPERQAVVRRLSRPAPPPELASTVLGLAPARRPAKRSRAPIIAALVVLLLGSGVAIAWWMGLLLRG